jgi:hypothetical protein
MPGFSIPTPLYTPIPGGSPALFPPLPSQGFEYHIMVSILSNLKYLPYSFFIGIIDTYEVPTSIPVLNTNVDDNSMEH